MFRCLPHLLVIALLLAACGSAAEPVEVPTMPPSPTAADDGPDLLTVTPETVAPGTVVEVTFAQSYPRGIAWQLDARVGDAWETRFWLTSDANGAEPVAVPVGTDGYGVEDVGVEGTGPDRLLVPAQARPGEYRLCTANAVDDVCVTLTVVGG